MIWSDLAGQPLKTAHNKNHTFLLSLHFHNTDVRRGQGSNLRRPPVPEGMSNYLLNDCVVMRRREGGRRRDTGGERDVSIDRSWFIDERRLLFYRHDAHLQPLSKQQ